MMITRQTWYMKETDGVSFLEFPILDKLGIVKHGFSTRLGGVSSGIFSSMNLSFTRGDNPDCVLENFKRISNAIGFDYRELVLSDQTHTNNIRVVTKEDKGKGIVKRRDYKDIDGLVTNVPNIPLATFYADCVPLFFVDQEKLVIGLSHSGWQGTVKKIASHTIDCMKDKFACEPKDIVVCIGPSICKDCYEVSEDVATRFNEVFFPHQVKEIIFQKENGKYLLDLWRANELILLDSGILKGNISLPGLCTCCNKDLLFSHRATNGKRGNLGAFLMLKEQHIFTK